jgi:DMSO reductase anchor subunit
MNPAYSVIFFTTASGAGYGLLALLGLTATSIGQSPSLAFVLVSMVIALALITAGLLSSTLHLGHPERAWRALSQWKTSWLSREGVAAIATYPFALAFGLTWSGLYTAPDAIAPLGVITAALSLITVFTTGKIYATLKTIRAWHQPLTVPVYLFFALASGSVLHLALLALFGRSPGPVAPVALISLGTLAVLKFLYWRAIDRAPRDRTMGDATGLGDAVRQWEVPHTTKNFVQREMGFVVARRHATRLQGLFFILLALVGLLELAAQQVPYVSLAATVVIYAAAWVERWLFFAEGEHVVTLFYGNQQA